MSVSVEQLMAAIRSVETGGQRDPYGVVNGIGAIGAYQVMYFNVAAWTKEALGRSLSREEFRRSKTAQDAVARYKLGQYLKKYGSWDRAAAVWFSGQPDVNSKASDGGNTVRQYVDKVKKALGAPAGPSPGGGTGTVLPTLGRSVFTAQQAGYAAEPSVGPYGAPTNPFKLPGWIASQSSGTTGGAGGGIEQVADGSPAGLFDDGISVPWDGVSTVVLSSLFVLGGVALVVVGLVAAVSPAAQKAASLHPAGKLATAVKAAT